MSRRSGNAKRTHGVAASSPDTGLALFNTTTCEPSDPTRPASMSSAEDSPVRTCRTLGRALASRVSALVCGSSSLASCATFDPASSSWRTSQRSLLGGSERFSESFPKAGMMRSGSLSALPTWELPTNGNGSSLSRNWPTPGAAKAGRDLLLTCSGDGRTTPNKLAWAVAELEPQPPTRRDSLNPAWVELLMGFPANWTSTPTAGRPDPETHNPPPNLDASCPNATVTRRD